jgi:excisionase family DNA binding protein
MRFLIEGRPGNWVTLSEACRRLGRSYATVYSMVLSGRLQAERVEGRWLVERDSLEAAMARQKRTSAR